MGNKACALPCMNTNIAEAENYDVRGLATGYRKTKLIQVTLDPEPRPSGIFSQLVDREKFIEYCGN